jgi:hypothetical protein
MGAMNEAKFSHSQKAENALPAFPPLELAGMIGNPD